MIKVRAGTASLSFLLHVLADFADVLLKLCCDGGTGRCVPVGQRLEEGHVVLILIVKAQIADR